jgi:hypothetical protein
LDALLPVEEQLSDDEYISLRRLTSEMRGWLKRSKEMIVEDVVVVKKGKHAHVITWPTRVRAGPVW